MKTRFCFPLNHLIAMVTPCLFALIFSAVVYSAQQQPNNNAGSAGQNAPQPLELGKPIEKELSGGGSHPYQVILTEGQYLKVVVEQRGIDLAAKLLGPDGKQITEADSEIRLHGQERISQIAAMAGRYQLVVQAKQKSAPTGKYEIQLVELRGATEDDRALQKARDLSVEFRRLYQAGKYDEARLLGEEELRIRERILGLEHSAVASSLNNLAALHKQKGDLTKAEALHLRALEIREKTLGAEHPDVAASLNNLATVYRSKGDYTKAELLHERALSIREKALGPEHAEVAVSLNNLANLYYDTGNYAKARLMSERTVSIWERELGPAHPLVAVSLNTLANSHYAMGDYAAAETFYQRALNIREKTLGAEHPDVALSLNNLAHLYKSKGDFVKAKPLLEHALNIREKVLGPNHPDVAQSLGNLASLYLEDDDNAKAELLLERALAIREKALGAAHPEVAASLTALANLHYMLGDYAKAEPLYQRSLAINEKALGSEHPNVAVCLNNLANFSYHVKRDYVNARLLHLRALAIIEKTLGSEHLDGVRSLNNLARVYEAEGQLPQAIAHLSRAHSVSERNLTLVLAAGSERQKLAYLKTLSKETSQVISLHARSAPNNQAAINLALTLILRRKGRLQDAMSDSVGLLRRRASPQDQRLFDDLSTTRAQLASLALRESNVSNPAIYQERLKQLEEKVESYEAELSTRSAEFRAQSLSVTLEAVQSHVAPNTALVEFAAYQPLDAKTNEFRPARYIAYMLPSRGEPRWADLGEAKPIDDAVAALRQAIRDPQSTNVKQLARAVDEKVMHPVRKLLGQTRQLMISPDGMLNLLPFAALVDEKDHYLVEGYSITYLSSGRDLLRLQVARESKEIPLIIANPDFGLAGGAIAQRTSAQPAQGQQEFGSINFRTIGGTLSEGLELKKLMPQATLLVGKQATEASLKQAHAPRLLHIATHGFFLQDAETPIEKTRGLELMSFSDLRSGAWAAKIENPLLRSGLALAGVNEHRNGDDDGVLTAMETASLDLWGTKLVVLSACDTGVGEIKNGEGVYGLRRALVLAGSETQVMSLWPVSDKATRGLMAGYYRRLLKSEGRGEALRQVQLEMLRNPQQRHPHYWASFIQAGEWANLDGNR